MSRSINNIISELRALELSNRYSNNKNMCADNQCKMRKLIGGPLLIKNQKGGDIDTTNRSWRNGEYLTIFHLQIVI